jgi:hypothetical protein
LADTATYEDKAKSLELVERQRRQEKSLNEKLKRWEDLSALLG